MLDLFVKGGPVMILIGLCAVCATVIVIERLLFFRSLSRENSALIPQLKGLLGDGKFREAEELCGPSSSPLARLISSGLEFSGRGEDAVKEGVAHASSRELHRIERYISALGTIANVSTLLGLLGTVSGNIRAFGVLAASGTMGNPALLAGAISEALITTAAGLVIAIPATIFYNYFVSRANNTITDIESTVGDMVLLMVHPEEGGKGAV